MFTDKQSMLYHAPTMLNNPNIPWVVSVEGDNIVARWKWMDALFFSPHEISDETKSYTYTVSLSDNGKYKALDETVEKVKGVSLEGGKLNFGTSTDMFKGTKNQKSFEFGIGMNKKTDEVGLVGFKYDTSQVKQHICSWLEANGWEKKSGLFG
jgi:hypothetical protein